MILILYNSSLLYYVMADAVVVVHSPSLPPKNKPTHVFIHICIGSDVNIICPEPNLLYLVGFTN